jgi:hypothetical protein
VSLKRFEKKRLEALRGQVRRLRQRNMRSLLTPEQQQDGRKMLGKHGDDAKGKERERQKKKKNLVGKANEKVAGIEVFKRAFESGR